MTSPRQQTPVVQAPGRDPALPSHGGHADSNHTYLAALVLVAITLTVFWRAQNYGFVWDDGVNVERNEYLKPVTLSNLALFWRAPFENLYVPVTYTVWAAIAHFARIPTHDGSVQLAPGAFHAANVLLHALSALMVFTILRLLIKHDWAAGAGAMLFALHPVQVEPVAWITGMKDVLSALLSLVAVWQYLEFAAARAAASPEARTEPRALIGADSLSPPARARLHYGVAVVAFLLALLSKPAAVVVPVIAWTLDACLVRRSPRASTVALAPWILIALPFVIFTKSQQPDHLLNVITPLWARPLVAADALAFYAYKVVLPIWIGPGYSRSPEFIFDEGWAYVTWVVPALLAVAVWYFRRSQPWLLAAAATFVAGLLPVLGLVQFQFQNWSTVADRYLYLSMLGPALALAWFAAQQWNKRNWAAMACGAILFLLGVKSAFQVQIWRNSESLWRYTLAIGQESAVARSNLAVTLVDTNLDEALVHLRAALALAPDFPDGHFNLASVLFRRGQVAEAIDHYQHILRVRPKFPGVHYALGIALAGQRRWKEAVDHYRLALQTGVPDAALQNSLGNALAELGSLDEAIEHYREAIKINPAYAGAYFNLGITLADRGDLDAAARQYLAVIQLQPDHANAHNNLADVLARQGRREAAIDHFREALRLRPDFPEAQRGLARLLGKEAKVHGSNRR